MAALYRDELLNRVLPFWETHSPDREKGGYFTCLLRDGTVFDTDKFVWLQCRQVWMFSRMYQSVEQRPEWLEMAKTGAEFLKSYGMDHEGNWYFALDRTGKPLVQPYNIFSDCFAAMALANYGQIAGSEAYRNLAVKTYYNILRRQVNPKGSFNKAFPGTRPLRNFALPMILSNLVLELEPLLPASEVNQAIERSVSEIMNVFYDPQRKLIFENVLPDGSHSDSFDGRLINPGHGIEAMWFLMDIGRRQNDQSLIRQCVEITLQLLEFGWDQEQGGIFYFLDSEGFPPQQLEWDQKLWWVHLEALVALASAIELTADPRAVVWFRRLHEYTWSHFPDPQHGEWYGYLRRDGSVLLPLKGGKWKGCFHVPRALWKIWKIMEKLESFSRA
jgi:N-acylglucosamine 2-epimerase